jgi:hypothetical protein
MRALSIPSIPYCAASAVFSFLPIPHLYRSTCRRRLFSITSPLRVRTVASRMSWEDVKTHIMNNHKDVFGRLEKDADEYDASLLRTREEWETVADFILHREFLLPVYVNPQTNKKYCDIQNDINQCQPQRNPHRYGGSMLHGSKKIYFSIQRNDFPYALLPPIEHLLMWCIPERLNTEDVQWILERDLQLSPNQYCFFENPPALRSIPQIRHFQIFTKNSVHLQRESIT